jgi:hypothetical protein
MGHIDQAADTRSRDHHGPGSSNAAQPGPHINDHSTTSPCLGITAGSS